MVKNNLEVQLPVTDKLIASSKLNKESTITYFDVQTAYEGTYFVKVSDGSKQTTKGCHYKKRVSSEKPRYTMQ